MPNFYNSIFYIYILPLESQQIPSPQAAGQKEDDALRWKSVDRCRVSADPLLFFRPQDSLLRANIVSFFYRCNNLIQLP